MKNEKVNETHTKGEEKDNGIKNNRKIKWTRQVFYRCSSK